MNHNELDRLLVDALREFGHLVPLACTPRGPLDPTQVAIEVAVPQDPGWSARPKKNVRKDLVIWSEPASTNWVGGSPLAVLEWKSLNNVGVVERVRAKREQHELDIKWLCGATERLPGLSGYAVFVDLVGALPTVECTAIRGGARLGDLRSYPWSG